MKSSQEANDGPAAFARTRREAQSALSELGAAIVKKKRKTFDEPGFNPTKVPDAALGSEMNSNLVELQFRADQFELRWADQFRMGNGHAEKLAFELRDPEIEEGFELRKAWRGIVFLPDVALEKRWMVRKTVKDFSGRQAEPGELSLKTIIARHFPFGHVAISLQSGDWAPSLEIAMIERDSFLVNKEDSQIQIASRRANRVLGIFAEAVSASLLRCARTGSAPGLLTLLGAQADA